MTEQVFKALLSLGIVIAIMFLAWAVQTFIPNRFYRAIGWGVVAGIIFVIFAVAFFHSMGIL